MGGCCGIKKVPKDALEAAVKSQMAKYPVIKDGCPCVHMVWVVPKEDEAAVDEFWATHEAWMRETHNKAGDEASPQLNHYYISKGEELVNPMDPEQGSTGNLVYTMSESYVTGEDIGKHMALGQVTEWWATLQEMMEKYGKFIDAGTTAVWKTMGENGVEKSHGTYPAIVADTVCIHMILKVPKEQEEEVDALWASHEPWMRASHNTGSETSPKLNHYYISKGEELVNPMDPESGKSGMVLYTMSETYVGAEDIKKHMEAGWEDMEKLMAIASPEKFLHFMDLNTKVFKTM